MGWAKGVNEARIVDDGLWRLVSELSLFLWRSTTYFGKNPSVTLSSRGQEIVIKLQKDFTGEARCTVRGDISGVLSPPTGVFLP